MYQDLLLALSGRPGTIFIRDSGGEFHICEGTPCLAPQEATLLNRILKIASCYHSLCNFTRDYGNIVKIRITRIPSNGGQYTLQLCEGISRGLMPYRDAILSLDKLVREHPNLPLSKVQYHLSKYEYLFPYLARITNKIATSELKGCGILDLIHEQSDCGIPFVKEALQELHQSCNSVFYQQLLYWLLYGQIKDPYNEFFIEEVDPVDDSEPEGILSGFRIVTSMVPAYLPLGVINTILFIGCSVLLFGKQNGASTPLPKEDEEMFIEQIRKLTLRSRFCPIEFERVIREIRNRVSEKLYSLLLNEGRLLDTLQLLKDFFLMGRGELFLIFFDTADPLMDPLSNKLTDKDINRLFRLAYTRLGHTSEEPIEKLVFKIVSDTDTPARGGKRASPTKSWWDDVNLTYNVPWPLQVLLTSDIIESYNMIFKFLLRVKRCQLALQTAWSVSMRRENKIGREALRLRSEVAFIIDNIQYYLHVDVLEANYETLISDINKTRDFEEIKSAHDRFISSLIAWTFQGGDGNIVREFLNKMIQIAFMVSNYIIKNDERAQNDLGNGSFELMTKNYQLCLTVMFRMLERGAARQHNSLLNQLLLRLDYNNFFSVGMENRRKTVHKQLEKQKGISL